MRMFGLKSKGAADTGKPGDLKRSAPLLALLLALIAGWLGWNGWQQWQTERQAERLAQARDEGVQSLGSLLGGLGRQMTRQLAAPAVAAALQAGDAAAASAALQAGWKGAEQAAVLPADLADAYTDPAAFGYARLALLESAQQGSVPVVRVVRDGGGARLGVAAPVKLGPAGGVAYVRLPLSVLTLPFDRLDVPASAYLALRQGGYSVAERGQSGLAGGGEALSRPLGKTGLRIAAAVPDVDANPLGLGAIGTFVVAVLVLALAAFVLLLGRGLAVRLPRLGSRGAAPAQDGPTLSQALETARHEAEHDAAAGHEASAPTAPVTAPPPIPVDTQVDPSIFRAYDIRGVVGQTLDPQVARLIGQAVGSLMQERGLREIVVGRDGRLSGPPLINGLIDGLRRAGIDVTDLGMVPTPLVYFACEWLRAGSGIALTGSHNPPDYNGFKIVVAGETLSGDAIAALGRRINEGRLHVAEVPGALQQRDVAGDYIQRIADDVQLERPLKVVADAGNGVAGDIAPRLLEAIGAEVIPLLCDVDGNFPNHHPDPSEPANLQDLIQSVQRFDADLGVAFDGDGDRLGVVTREGRIIHPDRLLMLFASDVLQRNPGALVIYDVKCTGKLSDWILRNGGSPLMWKTGHSLIKAKMRETDAELAGEMSGHFFFHERWYGFDDGLYAAARLLEILAQREESPSEVLDELPDGVSTSEIKVPVGDADAHALVTRLVDEAQRVGSEFEGVRLTTLDGLRADWTDGWGLVRASNTTPVLVLRFEAEDEAALSRIQSVFRQRLQALLPDVALPF